MRLVGEDERLQTLDDLIDTRDEIAMALERFPILLKDVHRS